jgi:2,5-diketo-D-gluconate reductase A
MKVIYVPDTASVYRNETQVGKAIADSGIPRSELFIVSKSGPSEHGYDNAIQACSRTLQNLGLSCITLSHFNNHS